MTLCIGQLRPITVLGRVFGCELFWCWVSLCTPFTISLIEFCFIMIFMIVVTIIGIFMTILFILGLLQLSISGWTNAQLPGCFAPLLDIPLEYRIEYVTLGLLYLMFTFPIMRFYRGVPGFETDYPCGVWCRGLTTCFLYIGPPYGNLV